MSIAGGVYNAILEAEQFGCTTVQLFNKSSNQWAAKPLAEEEIERFRAEAKRTGIAPLVSHTSYLINCASPDQVLYAKSVQALGVEYARCTALGIDYLVMHPGAHTGSGAQQGIACIAKAINAVYQKQSDSRTMICLESTSGAGTILGGTFEELREIVELIEDSSRVGICLDTCHIFTAGYDIRTVEGYNGVMGAFDQMLGLGRVKVWHFNDSKGALGSHKDRHEHIGRGLIGKAAFDFTLHDPRFAAVPKILETPKIENGKAMDPVNLTLLRRLARQARRSGSPPLAGRRRRETRQ